MGKRKGNRRTLHYIFLFVLGLTLCSKGEWPWGDLAQLEHKIIVERCEPSKLEKIKSDVVLHEYHLKKEKEDFVETCCNGVEEFKDNFIKNMKGLVKGVQ